LNSYNLLNESNASNILENLNNPDIELNSSLPKQSTSQNNGIIVITNSLVEEKVALYDNLSQIPKYYIKDEEYSK
ncbi:21815_t:CDS:2, partial [Dentiscutata erythropus]